jgi:hypothetical protein
MLMMKCEMARKSNNVAAENGVNNQHGRKYRNRNEEKINSKKKNSRIMKIIKQ